MVDALLDTQIFHGRKLKSISESLFFRPPQPGKSPAKG